MLRAPAEKREGGFIAAGDLEGGEQLRLANGSAAYVMSVTATGVVEPVYNFSVEGWHTYHVGELGVWVHNDNCFGKILLKAGIEKPPRMIDPHGHHIVFKKWKGAEGAALVGEGQAILKSVGLDPIKSPENLVWASNRSGMHRTEHLRAVVEDLRKLGPTPTRAQVVEVLDDHGQKAQERSLWQTQ